MGETTGSTSERGLRTIAQVVHAARRSKGWTQEDLSERSGVSLRAIQSLESGETRSPHTSTITLLGAALGFEGERLAELHAALRATRATPAALPVDPPDPDPILGREREMADLERHIDRRTRLLTLLGPGGVGKTRLARAVVTRLLAARGAPVTWVALESASAPDDVLPAVARACGVTESGEEPITQRIAGSLAGRPAWIVLDNFEHLVAAAPEVAALLAAAPSLSIIVTSREALRLRDERTYLIAPLPLPAAGDDPAGNPAVALFQRSLAAAMPHTAEAAAASDPGDGPTHLDDAARIVRLLDGLPLAIELAAAQSATMPVSTIAALLETSGLALLARGRRDASGRFATMDAAIAWSSDLLPPPAQRLFRLLGVFRGGFTADAILGVADRLGEPSLVTTMPVLAESHLVLAGDRQPAARMRMLEPVRMFARDRLAAAGEQVAARRAHAAHFLAWAPEQARLAGGPDPLPALDALDGDLPNLLAAFAAACEPETANVDAALAAASALSQYWEVRLRFREGRATLTAAIAAATATADPAAPPNPLLLDAMFWSGYLAYQQADLAAANDARASLAPLAERSGLPEHHVLVAILDVFAGDLAGIGPEMLLPPIRAAHESIASREQGIAWQQSLLLTANLLVETGDFDGALPLLRAYEGWAIRRKAAAHARGACDWLGLALLYAGNPEGARQQFLAALDGAEATRLIATHFMTLFGLAIANAALADGPDRLGNAARLHGAFDEMAHRHHFYLSAQQERLRSKSRERLAAELGQERFDALVAEGRALDADAVFAIARA
jgi:predicted ATPase/DNA-binding XRE family transcriptional regulator